MSINQLCCSKYKFPTGYIHGITYCKILMNIKQYVMRNYSLILTNISIFLTTHKRLISIEQIICSVGHLRQRGAKTFFYNE